MSEELITIGQITRHHGNKGEARVIPLTDYPERFEYLERVYLIKDGTKDEVMVEGIRYHKQFIIIKFVGIDGIGEIMPYKNYYLQIPKAEVLDLPENNFYLYDIIGIEVYTVEDEYLGQVKEVLETKANDVYVVTKDGDELLIPATLEVVLDIDLNNERMEVKLPPGLR
ncbi:ribosome maturation factor RimM [Natroniella sulfidigena]|uniref:ribosome maturation factor RimM n=1 Tax=Natroniella sulfidigena TaxID=723921 RepID=UPI00200A0AC3|nr:ribosome maturation factor RimM [Natroniella sulfidigena]MCK8816558.1 ribosome maturation factor RimM [Natroniella sulfidigena]